MEFFQKHFTKHHLFQQPHRWLLALLAAPLHLAEMHYKKKYHLNFVHAKKLFFFDLSLVAFIALLIITTIFWHTYDPTVEKFVELSIKSSTPTERTRSGEYLTYLVEYANKSKVKLADPQLAIELPQTFLIKSVEPADLFDSNTKTFDLPDLAPGSSGATRLTGLFYGNVGQEYHTLTRLSYQQEGASATELKLTNTITVLRDSVLEATLVAPEAILSHSTFPLTVVLKNAGEQTLSDIKLPLKSNNYFSFTPTGIPPQGIIEDNIWHVEQLKPNQAVKHILDLTTHINDALTSLELDLVPLIKVENEELRQARARHTFEVVQPKIELNAVWQDNIAKLRPGDTANLLLNLTNNGTASLTHLLIELPVPSNVVDINKLINQNSGRYTGGNFSISSAFLANLKNLDPGDSTSVQIEIPIKNNASGGTDPALSISPKLSAQVPQVPDTRYQIETTSPSIQIGTNALLTAEARYYTAEGDQLGRGPLPPETGKETKYWAIITIQNTTSKISNLNFLATLPAHVKWTGKSSVSHGADLVYNANDKKISWSLNSLYPSQTVGLYMELSLTPNFSQIGTTPVLLKDIQFSGIDSYTGFGINKNATNIDISLVEDNIGRNRGVVVK